MAHRMFSDASGREWLVWDVIPVSAAASGETRHEIEVPITGQRRGERPRSFSHLPTALAGGWLCFESGVEKKRLGPIPAGWDHLPDAELERLMQSATVVSGREGHLDTAKMRAMTRPSRDQHR